MRAGPEVDKIRAGIETVGKLFADLILRIK